MTDKPSNTTAEAIHADPHFLLRVLASLNDHFVMFDRQWRYTYVNDAAARMLGLPKERLLGQCIWELFPEAVGNLFYRQLHRALAEQCDLSFEHFYEPWGRWYENRIYAFPDGVSVLGVDITARKQAEAEAQQKAQEAEEARRILETLLEHVPEGITMTGEPPDFPIVANSKLVQTLLGRPSADLLGMPAGQHAEAFDLYLADGVTRPTPEQMPLYRATHYGETIENEEWVIRRPDGALMTVLVKVAPILDSEGQIAGAINCWRDISERKQMEQALRASEERFSKAFHASPQPMCITRVKDGAYIDVNERFARMVGYPRTEIIGRTSLDIGIWSDPEERTRTNEVILHQGGNQDFEHRFRDRNGNIHEIISAGQLIELEEQPCILSVVSDITERKAAEERLRFMTEATAVLTSSLDYAATLQQVANLVVPRLADWCSVDILQPDGTIELVAVAHVDPAKVAWGRELRRRFPPDLNAAQGLPNVLRTGQAEFYPDIPFEQLRQAAKDEEQRQILAQLPIKSLIIVPLRIRDQVIGAIQLVWADSDRRYTEADLRFAEEFAQRAALAVDNARLYQEARMAAARLQEFNTVLEQRVAERTAELERSNRELDQFAYVASHDLKAPLRAISHLATWISEDAYAALPAASQEHLAKLHRRIKRMEQLLDDLLAYSRAGRTEYPPEHVDAAVLVKDVIETLAPPPGFTFTVQQPAPVFVTARVPLETTLRNLIANAIKHHDRPNGQIHVSIQEQGQVVTFTVADDGPGIAPEFHQRIFEMFTTLQPRDQVEGSGVGLAIVKKTVESCGGTIQVESNEGHGAVFRFTWPKKPALQVARQ